MRPSLPSTSQCCACGACVDVCPRQALQFSEDENAFYCIIVKEESCNGCGLCEKRCHILHPEVLERHDACKVQPLAGWSLNQELIRKSASGGVFAQIAYHFLKSSQSSFVYGAALQPDDTVCHMEISHYCDLPVLQNSKYQQSNATGCYKMVRKRLRQGARVLFSGVPCHIAALYSFLQGTPLDNLYTIEVLCHGVPSNELHRKALKFEHASHIVSYRTKDDKGWIGNNNRLTYLHCNGKQVTKKKHVYDFLFRAYLEFSFNRKNCFSCQYATLNRVADITLGDFWGWNLSADHERYRNHMGTSILFPNSEKGKKLAYDCPDLYVTSASWEEILPYNQNLYMPTNDALFYGANYIRRLRCMPSFVQKFVYQNGFSNRYLNEIYRRCLNLLVWPRRRKQEREKQQGLQTALRTLNTGKKS
ncbi:MAG: Coenzyme F420 hydrogenase/dehydrogenase, beta subunit C-terminal domain [Bacteroidales bacterium]|nr:Coenzyme F420 hydrogenase/dehydrogenase, beta subunit C-terminal domain [Bacteroidales bacterium]